MKLTEYHRVFPGSVRWRVTRRGVEVEGSGLIVFTPGQLSLAENFMKRFQEHYESASSEYGVPVELLMACSLTEASPRTQTLSVREEPGYISDHATPHRVSIGLCQLLISTAREVMKDPSIDRSWLFSPLNSLRACAAYMKRQSRQTHYDPILVACAYNAGGIYENKSESNRWRIRQFPIGTGKHADRFAAYFAAAMHLTDLHAVNGNPYRGLL